MLNYLKKEIILSTALLMVLTACAKLPESPISPSVKISVENKGESKIYAVFFTCGFKNENSSKTAVLTVPFKIPAILPLETGVVQQRIDLNQEQVTPLLELTAIRKEQVESGEDLGNRFIEDKNILIKKLNMDKTDIIELLRGKLKK